MALLGLCCLGQLTLMGGTTVSPSSLIAFNRSHTQPCMAIQKDIKVFLSYQGSVSTLTGPTAQQHSSGVAPVMLHTTKEEIPVPAQVPAALRAGTIFLQARVGGRSAHVPLIMMKMQLLNLVLLGPRSTDPRQTAEPAGGGGTGAALRSKHWGAKWSPEEGKAPPGSENLPLCRDSFYFSAITSLIDMWR